MADARITLRHNRLGSEGRRLVCSTAGRCAWVIRVCNATTNSPPVDAESIVWILTLGVLSGDEILVSVDAENEERALAELRSLVESNFGEGE